MPDAFSFRLLATDGVARRGEIATPHGAVATPAFLPIGTQATVKGLAPEAVRATGADIVLANTYHLMLRPGAERIASLGGLHRFMNWPWAILTDSGGFQVMSLSQLRKIEDKGVTFRSHLDGDMVELSPERAIEVQHLLGSDIAMQLDECLQLPASQGELQRAMRLSLAWAERSKRAFERTGGTALFAIVQGGDDLRLRAESARVLTEMGFHGHAIGGLAVGEPQQVMLRIVEAVASALPAARPRANAGREATCRVRRTWDGDRNFKGALMRRFGSAVHKGLDAASASAQNKTGLNKNGAAAGLSGRGTVGDAKHGHQPQSQW